MLLLVAYIPSGVFSATLVTVYRAQQIVNTSLIINEAAHPTHGTKPTFHTTYFAYFKKNLYKVALSACTEWFSPFLGALAFIPSLFFVTLLTRRHFRQFGGLVAFASDKRPQRHSLPSHV